MSPIQRTPIGDQVHAHLQQELLSGAYLPGESLQDTVIAMEVGVSRTPVREALHRLSREGLLETLPGRGFRVRPLDVNELREVYPILSTLEGFALSTVGEFPQRVLDNLEKLNRDFGAPVRDPRRLLETDTRWHETLVGGCGNERLISLIRQQRAIVRRYEIVYMHALDLTTLSHDDHRAICELLRAGKTGRAVAALERHWRRSLEAMAKLPIGGELP